MPIDVILLDPRRNCRILLWIPSTDIPTPAPQPYAFRFPLHRAIAELFGSMTGLPLTALSSDCGPWKTSAKTTVCGIGGSGGRYVPG
jgi:hypothetical protein